MVASALALCACAPEEDADGWREYVYNELGLAIEFPTAPSEVDLEFQTVITGGDLVPAVDLSASQGNAKFKLTVASFRTQRLVALGANIMGECYFDIEREGVPISNLAHRAEDGTRYGIHGRIVTVDIEEVGRQELGCFVAKGRLYKTDTIIPLNPSAKESEAASRFVRSMRFDVGEAG
jgi:hypothetical protein